MKIKMLLLILLFLFFSCSRDGNIISGKGYPQNGDINGAVAEFTITYLEALNETI